MTSTTDLVIDFTRRFNVPFYALEGIWLFHFQLQQIANLSILIVHLVKQV